jgi:hypothetical protein
MTYLAQIAQIRPDLEDRADLTFKSVAQPGQANNFQADNRGADGVSFRDPPTTKNCNK